MMADVRRGTNRRLVRQPKKGFSEQSARLVSFWIISIIYIYYIYVIAVKNLKFIVIITKKSVLV